jgi:RNA polymerase sigma-70 factor, ECF subfamily
MAHYDETMGLSEQALALRLLARDEKALKEVIDEHGAYVYGMARRVLQDADMAEEVAQDTFVALWRRPGAFDADRGRLRSFLVGVARNKAIDLVRRQESRRRTAEVLKQEFDVQHEASATDRVEDQQGIRAALAQLPEQQREALLLAYFGGRTYREVAEELGIPEGTAKTRLRDGLTKLRVLMAGEKEQ